MPARAIHAVAGVLCSLAAACFTTNLDPNRPGVFACEGADDCPGDQRCINRVCEIEDAPTVELARPEHLSSFAPAENIAFDIELAIKGLTLVDPDETDEHVFGEGHIRLVLDGEPLPHVTNESDLAFVREIRGDPGPHRISATIHRNDGIAYDHAEAQSNRLLWVDDGEPHVAITVPWPLDAFPIEATDPFLVAIETINFDLRDPVTVDQLEGFGHAHIVYEVAGLASCREIATNGCDGDGYLGLIGARGDVCPTSDEGSCARTGFGIASSMDGARERLAVTLRFDDHTPYLPPRDPEPPGDLVFDEIQILRVRAPSGERVGGGSGTAASDLDDHLDDHGHPAG
jgi:hypothetical protein